MFISVFGGIFTCGGGGSFWSGRWESVLGEEKRGEERRGVFTTETQRAQRTGLFWVRRREERRRVFTILQRRTFAWKGEAIHAPPP